MDDFDIILLTILSIVVLTNICCKIFKMNRYSFEASVGNSNVSNDRKQDPVNVDGMTKQEFNEKINIFGINEIHKKDKNITHQEFDFLENQKLAQHLKNFQDSLTKFNDKTVKDGGDDTDFNIACNDKEAIEMGKDMESKLKKILDELKDEHSKNNSNDIEKINHRPLVAMYHNIQQLLSTDCGNNDIRKPVVLEKDAIKMIKSGDIIDYNYNKSDDIKSDHSQPSFYEKIQKPAQTYDEIYGNYDISDVSGFRYDYVDNYSSPSAKDPVIKQPNIKYNHGIFDYLKQMFNDYTIGHKQDLDGSVTIHIVWADWCGYSNKAMEAWPKMKQIVGDNHNGIKIDYKDVLEKEYKHLIGKGKEYDVTGFPTLFVRGMINNKKVDQEFNAIEHGDMSNKVKQIIEIHSSS